MNCPKTWLRGTRFRKRMGWKKRSYFRYFLISVSSGSRLARILPCVITTPRGSAVVPEGKIISSVELRRSEEHTSELQSRLHLVCRLLLEKKKKKLSYQASIISQ